MRERLVVTTVQPFAYVRSSLGGVMAVAMKNRRRRSSFSQDFRDPPVRATSIALFNASAVPDAKCVLLHTLKAPIAYSLHPFIGKKLHGKGRDRAGSAQSGVLGGQYRVED